MMIPHAIPPWLSALFILGFLAFVVWDLWRHRNDPDPGYFGPHFFAEIEKDRERERQEQAELDKLAPPCPYCRRPWPGGHA